MFLNACAPIKMGIARSLVGCANLDLDIESISPCFGGGMWILAAKRQSRQCGLS